MTIKKTNKNLLTVGMTACLVLFPISLSKSPHIVNNSPINQPITSINKEKECRKDRECWKMAEALVYESRGEGRKGMIAVAWVIKNRSLDKRWPDSIVDVIRQPRQFSYIKDWKLQTKPSEDDWSKAFRVSYDVMNDVLEDITGGANHYHTIKVKPRWANKLEYAMTIGQHRFYK